MGLASCDVFDRKARFHFLILIFAWLLAAETQAGQQGQFNDWMANCDSAGACEVFATVNAVRLSLVRPGIGEPLALLLTAPGIAPDSDLTLAVDRHPKISLNTVDDLAQESGKAALSILSQEAKYQLMRQMRDGANLTVAHRNQYQQKVAARIGLRGLNQALEFIDESQGKTRVISQQQALPATAPAQELEQQPKPAGASRRHWASELAGLMPAIMGCLEWVPGTDQLIDKAWASGGSVTVRSRHRVSGARVACVLPADGSSIEMIDALKSGAEYLPGEGDPVFTPKGHNRPFGECLDHEEVSAPDGTPLGWLSFLSC
jgi:hypothetical protein